MRYAPRQLLDEQFGWIMPSQLNCDPAGISADELTRFPIGRRDCVYGGPNLRSEKLFLFGFTGQLAALPTVAMKDRPFPVLLSGSSLMTLLDMGTLVMGKIELIVDHSMAADVDVDTSTYSVRFEEVAALPMQTIEGVHCLDLAYALKEFASDLEPVWLFDMVSDLLDSGLVARDRLAWAVDSAGKKYDFHNGEELVNYCENPQGHPLEFLWAA